MPIKYRATASGVLVSIYVRPSSKRDAIETTDEIAVYTREPPEGNRANTAAVKMLSRALGIPRGSVSIVRGSASRVKEIHIAGITPDRLECLNGKKGVGKAGR